MLIRRKKTVSNFISIHKLAVILTIIVLLQELLEKYTSETLQQQAEESKALMGYS